MLSGVAAFAINELLQRESWARDKLVPFAGKTARLAVPPAAFTFTVQADGYIGSGDGTVPDVTITVAAASLPEALRDVEGATSRAEVTGDAELAKVIAYLFAHLRWDVEEDLSRVFGDVAAHRIAGFGREMAAVPGRIAHSVSHSLTAYLQEERGVIPARNEVAQFTREVDTLRDDAARLEKRIEQLEARFSGSNDGG